MKAKIREIFGGKRGEVRTNCISHRLEKVFLFHLPLVFDSVSFYYNPLDSKGLDYYCQLYIFFFWQKNCIYFFISATAFAFIATVKTFQR